jgi:hypothetical protein
VFDFLGLGSGDPVEVAIYSGEDWLSHYRLRFLDDSEDWRTQVLFLGDEDASSGSFNLSDIRIVRFNLRPTKPSSIRIRGPVLGGGKDDDGTSGNLEYWQSSESLNLSPAGPGMDVTYRYTLERQSKGFYWASMYNSLAFHGLGDDWDYLLLTLSRADEIEVRASLGKPGEGPALRKISEGILDGNRVLHRFAVPGEVSLERITLSFGVRDHEGTGDYSFSILEMALEQDWLDASWRIITGERMENSSAPVVIRGAEMAATLGDSVPPSRIEVERKSPTRYSVQVHDATGPFILASNIRYDSGWLAETAGSDLDHLEVNGLYNGWSVDRTGSYVVDISYKRQKFQWWLTGMSTGAVITVALALLGIELKKRQAR